MESGLRLLGYHGRWIELKEVLVAPTDCSRLDLGSFCGSDWAILGGKGFLNLVKSNSDSSTVYDIVSACWPLVHGWDQVSHDIKAFKTGSASLFSFQEKGIMQSLSEVIILCLSRM